jgi:hypothetical protein
MPRLSCLEAELATTIQYVGQWTCFAVCETKQGPPLTRRALQAQENINLTLNLAFAVLYFCLAVTHVCACL